MPFGESLLFRIGADSSKFMKEGKKAQGFAGKLKANMRGIFSIGAAIGFVAVLKQITQELDEINKTAQKIGLQSDFLQEIQFGGERSGVAINTTNMALQRFTRRMAEARKGQGELRQVIVDNNIALFDQEGQVRSTEQVFTDLADIIQKTEDPAERLRIAFKAFDSEGVALVNLMKNGSQGLAEFREQARKTGQVIEKDLLDKASKFNDQMGTLKGGIKGTAINLGGALLSYWEQFGIVTAKAVNKIEGIPTVIESTSEKMERLSKTNSKINEEMEDSVGLLQAIKELESKREEIAFDNMNLEERRTYFLKKEAGLMTEILRIGYDTEEGIRKQIQLEDLRVEMQENYAALEKEADRKKQQSLDEQEAALKNQESLQQTRLARLETENQLQAEQTRILEEQAALEERKLKAAKDRVIASQVGNAPSERDIFNLSGKTIEEQLRRLDQQIKTIQAEQPGPIANVIGDDPLINQRNRLQNELDTRQRFSRIYSRLGDTAVARQQFDPLEFDRRVAQFNNTQSKLEETNALLKEIRDEQRGGPRFIGQIPRG